jgi:hypothetical protein
MRGCSANNRQLSVSLRHNALLVAGVDERHLHQDKCRIAAVLHGSPTSSFNDLNYTENVLTPQTGVDCIGIDDFTR